MTTKTNGMTLVEVLVTIVIVAILALGAGGFFSFCERFIVDSELRLMAVNFAAEVMEERYWNSLIDETPDTSPVDGIPDWVTAPPPLSGSRIDDYYSGARHYKVATSTDGSYRIIETKVTWEY